MGRTYYGHTDEKSVKFMSQVAFRNLQHEPQLALG
jgi:hypothetical protein